MKIFGQTTQMSQTRRKFR